MAKGEDAVRRRRSKANRKRIRNCETSVSDRVAAIIAAKRRRKAGKRRICEGMCFSLPTPDDPFNEGHGKKETEMKRKTNKNKLKKRKKEELNSPLGIDKKLEEKLSGIPDAEMKFQEKSIQKPGKKGLDNVSDIGTISKFLVLCLKAVENAWVNEGIFNEELYGNLLASTWGADFCRICMSGSSIVETSGACATREQVAWLVSMAADIVARKESQGIIVPSPFLLFLVSSRDRAIEVRSVCKPLKALGVHTVSLHSGASLDYQVQGLRSCEAEFLVCTPERLVELVLLNAVDVSSTSLLVIDGLREFVNLGLMDKLKSIRDNIVGKPQVIIFTGSQGDLQMDINLQSFIRGPLYNLSTHQSIASLSALAS
ncbi:hypothetical protein HPP92_024104 [Vanilla planifolia]|uniref:Uncharacterized protein n=1 Tax=Vanilla planifolia TaxID=51239 RepID=A0A835PQ41_VANPL|nr:hypothetical protein HPP92_024104 [Vanilla planifolia]